MGENKENKQKSCQDGVRDIISYHNTTKRSKAFMTGDQRKIGTCSVAVAFLLEGNSWIKVILKSDSD